MMFIRYDSYQVRRCIHLPHQGTKNISILDLSGQVTYNFHLSCKHMHLSHKSVYNKEHKGVICNKISSSTSLQSTHPTGRTRPTV